MRILLLGSLIYFLTIFTAGHQLSAQEYSPEQFSKLLNKADSLRKLRKLDAAISVYTQLLNSSAPDSLKGKAFYGKGYAQFSLNEIPSSLESFQKSVESFTSYLPNNHYKIARPYAMLGYLYRYFQVNERLALKNYQLELQTILANPSRFDNNRKFYSAYNLATTYRLIQDYEFALSYAFQGLNIAQSEENPQLLELSYSVIANTYNVVGKKQEAIKNYLKKIAITQKLRGQDADVLTKDFDNLGLAQVDLGNYNDALSSYKKSLNISTRLNKNADRAYTLMLIGNLYEKISDFKKAKCYLTQALNLSTDRDTELLAYESLASMYSKKNQFDSTQYYYQKSIATKLNTKVDGLLKISLERLEATTMLFKTLQLSAKAYLNEFKVGGDVNALKKANDIYTRIDSIAFTKRSSLSSQESKLFFQKSAYQLYEGALETMYLLQESKDCENCIDKAWHFMEVNRNIVLREQMNRAQRYQDLGVSDSIKSMEKEFHRKSASLRSKIVSCGLSEECSEEEIIIFRNQWLKNEQQFNIFIDEVKNLFPKYYNLSYQVEPVFISDYQERMADNELLISYFQGKHHIYWLSVSGQSKKFGRVQLTKELEGHISMFLEETSGKTLSQQSLQSAYSNFHTSAYQLYQALVNPPLRGIQPEKLVILANGKFSEVSFEALIQKQASNTEGIDFKHLDYLINNYEINYALSANLLYQTLLRETGGKSGVLAFGNPSSKNQSLLPGSAQELKSIKRNISSPLIFDKENATKSNFEEAIQSNKFDILHFSLHGSANKSNPLNSKLVFSDNKKVPEDTVLHLYELYALNLSAKLVVLSACETNIGQWSKGEGTISLARGFAYNNNPNIITSLWKINDSKSAQIISDFYENISSEKGAGKSLREAKLEFLNSSNELTSHPSNWAALVHFGNANLAFSSKRLSQKLKLTLAILVGLLLITGMYYLYKKRLTRMNKSPQF